ncbi:hypothetical protein CKO25_00305 [Thiocapsa imhoffii]|uniref:Cobalamin ABC transporter n=1 Tax=Thiocapsa imhoffii TaxID=382777 RepID=A0A9X0WF10_9GAMM|nr:hypothetical protein [Thiocapsa imhoffii]MBK1643119.1 hypothetical protein [Thiocapsa imhoffii]
MTPIADSRVRILIGIGLAALMAATRGQQFAPLAHHLPDASLAVFFLAGFYLRSLWVFPALFGLATLIDLTATGWGGVSSYCMTPAYWMLVPAYGVVWGLGRWSAGRFELTRAQAPALLGVLLVAGVGAEVFASGGFYLFSGYFSEPTATELLGRFVTYLPATLLHLALYVGLAMVAHFGLTRARPATRATGASGE